MRCAANFLVISCSVKMRRKSNFRNSSENHSIIQSSLILCFFIEREEKGLEMRSSEKKRPRGTKLSER